MPKNERGDIWFIVVFVWIAAFGLLMYILVSSTLPLKKTILSVLFPKPASLAYDEADELRSSIKLVGRKQAKLGESLVMDVLVKNSRFEVIKLDTKIHFSNLHLKVEKIDSTVGFIPKLKEESFANELGEISLVGETVISPQASDRLLARIVFRIENPGLTRIFLTDQSGIFASSSKANVIDGKEDLVVEIKTE